MEPIVKRLIITLACSLVDFCPIEEPPKALPAGLKEQTPAEKRKLLYVKAFEAAKKHGAATYQSDGKPGDQLPEGRYRLFWAVGPDGVPDVFYEENRMIVPRPDFDCST